MLGALLDRKSINKHMCEFLTVVVFPLIVSMIFLFWRVLCSSYVGSFFDSFFASDFDRLLVRFGTILNHFASPNRSLLASIFG